jgi:hypothetical protein
MKRHTSKITKIYPDRVVSNIYFDTVDLENAQENIEGVGLRIKPRLRWYDRNNKYIFEFKVKRGDVGTKFKFNVQGLEKSDLVSLSSLKTKITQSLTDPFFREYFNSCGPVVTNNYLRSYYGTTDKKIIITVDKKVEGQRYQDFCSERFPRSLNKDEYIVEIKFDEKNQSDVTEALEDLPFRLTKNSKYLRVFENCYF